jgi:hypothetical protein
MLARKKKPSAKVQEVPSRPPSTEDSVYAQGDLTPEDQSQIQPQSSANRAPRTEARAQINQQIAKAMGGPIQLSDSQFRVLLERLAADPGFTIPTVETPLNPQLRRTSGNDPDDSPSDSSSHRSHRSYRNHRSRSHRRQRSPKRSPKHDDPEKLDNSTSPTYVAWRSLLRGKLRANVD